LRSADRFIIGEWTVVPSLNRIERPGRIEVLGPKIMHVLVTLAERQGDAVTREDLAELVWADTIVSDETITVAVSDLRRALGDRGRDRRYVETIRLGGYRLICPVESVPDEIEPPVVGAPLPTAPVPPPLPRPVWRSFLYALAVLAPLVATLWYWHPWSGGRDEALPPPPAVTLTDLPGSELQPALSPDGRLVAYAWDGGGEDFDLWIRDLSTGEARSLTQLPGAELRPAWSPDGRSLAFVHADAPMTLRTVPADGGPSRVLLELPRAVAGLDWSPDGLLLALSLEGFPPRLLSVDVVDAAVDTLPVAMRNLSALGELAWSPDGASIAVVGDVWGRASRLLVTPRGGTPTRTAGPLQHAIAGLDWTPAGDALVFAADPGGLFQLFDLPLARGHPRWLPTGRADVAHPSVGPGGLVVFEDLGRRVSVWQVRLDADTPAPEPLLATPRNDWSAAFSSDGERLLYLSTRSGGRELWTARADGASPRRLARAAGLLPADPQWSPDGGRVAFTGTVEDGVTVFVLSAHEDVSTRVVTPGTQAEFAGWLDDTHVLAIVRRGGHSELRSIGLDGGELPLMTDVRRLVGFAPRSGRPLVLRTDTDGLWRLEPNGRVFPMIIASDLAGWSPLTVAPQGVLGQRDLGDGPALWLRTWDGAAQRICGLPERDVENLRASPDGRVVIFDRVEADAVDLAEWSMGR
jgi:Tol biopolymer transport system component/DNA-binding winged helix-turn-helix (wHTH) protein